MRAPESDVELFAVEFSPEGVRVSYVRRQDVRENGLVWQHQVAIPRGSDYDDEIEAAEEAVMALLLDALDDEDRVPAAPLLEEEEDDDDD